MYRLLRPLLFALPSEAAHAAALTVLRGLGVLPWVRPAHTETVHLLGLEFPNRIGLAAGFDKNAAAIVGLARLGFGFVEVGTVTPRPQPGNPRPRLFRLVEDRALINRMGFNSAGIESVAANLVRIRRGEQGVHIPIGVPVGINIGKNPATPLSDAAADYLACFSALHSVADYVVVNLSSPNTPGLRDLQAAATARALIAQLAAARDRLAAGKPLLVKVAPDLAPADLEATVAAALEAGANGFVAVNTTLARPASLGSRRAMEAGGLSGRPLFPLALDTVRRLRSFVGDAPAVIGVGGISSSADARALLDAGADLVQVYTALVYQGPGLVRRLAREVSRWAPATATRSGIADARDLA